MFLLIAALALLVPLSSCSVISAASIADIHYVNACLVSAHTFTGKSQIFCTSPKSLLCRWFGSQLRPSSISCSAYRSIEASESAAPSVEEEWQLSLAETLGMETKKDASSNVWMQRHWSCTSDRGYIFDTQLRCKDLPCPDLSSDCVVLFDLTPTFHLFLSALGFFVILSLLLVAAYNLVTLVETSSATSPTPHRGPVSESHLNMHTVTPAHSAGGFFPSGKMD